MSSNNNDNNLQELMSIFQIESEDIIERIFEHLLAYESKPKDRELAATLYRELHSLKGAIRMVGFNNIQTIIHKIEDIFDQINNSNAVLDSEKFIVITRSIEIVEKYLQESVANQREILGEEFNSTISTLEYICDVELGNSNNENDLLQNLLSIAEAETDTNIIENTYIDLQQHQEEINFTFNSNKKTPSNGCLFLTYMYFIMYSLERGMPYEN